MFLSRKKRQEEEANRRYEEEHQKILEELSKPPCQRQGGQHMWRDFPPYISFTWEGNGRGNIEIIEKYVCTLCHKTTTKTLESLKYADYKRDLFFKDLEETQKKYKDFIKPRAIVEDMVNDAIMVDRQKLKFWDQLHAPEKSEKEPIELKVGRESEYFNDMGGQNDRN